MNLKTADKLVSLRKQNGLSQEALAAQLGISRQSISKWERGESSPDTDNLIALARIYGITIDELLNDETKIDNSINVDMPAVKASRIYPKLSKALFKFPLPFIIVAIYLAISLTTKIWHPTWLMFMIIPIYYHFAGACCTRSKKGFLFALPVPEIVVAIYLILAFSKGIWASGAILFIIIPVYYWIVAFYKSKDTREK